MDSMTAVIKDLSIQFVLMVEWGTFLMNFSCRGACWQQYRTRPTRPFRERTTVIDFSIADLPCIGTVCKKLYTVNVNNVRTGVLHK